MEEKGKKRESVRKDRIRLGIEIGRGEWGEGGRLAGTGGTGGGVYWEKKKRSAVLLRRHWGRTNPARNFRHLDRSIMVQVVKFNGVVNFD